MLTAPFAPQTRVCWSIKEVKTFFRDTSQWSQLILLLALVVVYVYNFSVLPLQGSPLVTFYFKNVIAFLNLALAALRHRLGGGALRLPVVQPRGARVLDR